MIELISVQDQIQDVIEHVAFIHEVGRVASFRLATGAAIPETRATPVLMVALTDLAVEVSDPSHGFQHVILQAGQAHLLASGVAGLANVGPNEARFTLVDLPMAD